MFPPAIAPDATVQCQVQQEQEEVKIKYRCVEKGVFISWRLQTGGLS